MAWKRFTFASDSHGDNVDPKALAAFYKFLKLWKPDIRIAGGDHFDVRAFRRGADEEEKRDSMLADIEAGCEFIETFKPTHCTLGNHDIRLYDMRDANKGPISDFASEQVSKIEDLFQKVGCKIVLPYDKRLGILQIGKARFAHGYCTGVTAARKMAASYGSIHFGHTHGIQTYSVEGLDNRIGRNCGCLCKLDMAYNRAQLGSLVHRHGWAYGIMDDNSGEYQSYQAESINGRWIFPTGFKEI